VQVAGEREDEAWLTVPSGLELNFGPVPEPKAVKNRIHLDLAHRPVEELLSLGATQIDIGQGDVPWTVLADPEGNEFCVLDQRDKYAGRGSLAAIVVECYDPRTMAYFWTQASGYFIHDTVGAIALEAPSGEGPFLEFIPSGAVKTVKNRVHLDVAPGVDDDHRAEVERLLKRGARRVDVGQGDVPWIVLADPEGNEFCLLRRRID
jgi:hypothetical protein